MQLLEDSGAVRLIYKSLGVKGLNSFENILMLNISFKVRI